MSQERSPGGPGGAKPRPDRETRRETPGAKEAPDERGSPGPAGGAQSGADHVDEAAARPEGPGRRFKPRVLEDPLIGRVLQGRYRIDCRIGSGGMGTVYRARQLSVDRDVAIKVLRGEGVDPTHIKRFFQEAQAASLLRSRHTITVIDFGETEDGIYYMAMELLQGKSLHEVLEDGPMPPAEAVTIARHICLSLREAHSRGIIHRDLKPSNISLEPSEDEPMIAKVLDFGIAKWYREGGSVLTMAGSIYGTPQYMSPEQCRSDPLDARSDLYSLGILLYEMLAGRPPFEGANPTSLILAQVGDEPPPLRSLAPSVPEDLARLVHKLLHKDPDQRYQNADEVIRALDDLRLPRPVAVAVPQDGEVADLLGDSSIATTQLTAIGPPDIPPATESAERKPWGYLILAALATFLVGLGLAGWQFGWWGHDGTSGQGAGAAAAPDAGLGSTSVETADAGHDAGVQARDASAADVSAADTGPAQEAEQGARSMTVGIELTTDPPGAFAIINQTSVRNTPVTLRVLKGKRAIEVLFKKDGYREVVRKIVPDRDKRVEVRLEPSSGPK